MKVTDEMVEAARRCITRLCDKQGGIQEVFGGPMYAENICSMVEAALAAAPGTLPEERPTIVCLCGSTRFSREFRQAGLRETLAGRIVLSIGAASGTDDEHFGNLSLSGYEQVKAQLDELHLRKIELADEVLILNVGGYIGESTQRELDHARNLDKRVRFLERAAERQRGEE